MTAVSSWNTAWGLLALTGALNATSAGGKSISAPAAKHGTILFASPSSATVIFSPAPAVPNCSCSRHAIVDSVSFGVVVAVTLPPLGDG